MRDLATLSVLGPEGVSDADAKSSLEALTYAAAEGFWKAIAEGEVPVSLHGRKLAQEVYAKHWQLNRASAAPLAPSSVTLTAPITAPSPVAIAKGET